MKIFLPGYLWPSKEIAFLEINSELGVRYKEDNSDKPTSKSEPESPKWRSYKGNKLMGKIMKL